MQSNLNKRLKCNDDESIKSKSKKSKPSNFNEENTTNLDLPSCSKQNCENSSQEISNPKETTGIDNITQKNEGIEDVLICSICQDIMYNCVSIQPCLHSFCAICLLTWRKSGESCPTCRGVISIVSKNHLVENIVNKFLIENPSKSRSDEEKKEADEEVKKNMKILFRSENNSSANSTIVIDQNNCNFCNYPGVIFPTLSLLIGSDRYCDGNTEHVQCHCCSVYIPTVSLHSVNPKTECQMCHKYSCFLYLGSCKNCDIGCLFIFKNFIFNTNFNNLSLTPQFISDNFYETNVLRNYLESCNMSVHEMYNQCLSKLATGHIVINNINESSTLCIKCAKHAMMNLVFQFCQLIPKSNLPREVTSRPDCYYGRNCRTQRHRLSHCEKYNHICPQTKF